MLTINLQQIVDEINARRNSIHYQFQEIAMMLTEKLGDPRHKSLYMKLAKNEEQELLMDAMHYVLASPEASGNLGALFMWKLKELKDRPILPVPILLETEVGRTKIGTISGVTRGDMPLLLAALAEFTEKTKTSGAITQEQLAELPKQIYVFLQEFNRTATVQLFTPNVSQICSNSPQEKWELKLARPQLCKVRYNAR